MSTRIWLRPTATEALVKTDKKRYDADEHVLDGIPVDTDKTSGGKYITIYDPFDPANNMPRIAHKYIKRVSSTDNKIHEGFRTDGIYRHKGATARVETIERTHTAFGANDTSTTERYQIISVSAGSIKTLREIYSKIRTGELKPEKDWGVDLHKLELRQQKAAQPAPATSEAITKVN